MKTKKPQGSKKRKADRAFQLSPLQYPDPVQAIEIIGKQKNLFPLLSAICIFPIFSIFALFCPFSVIQYTLKYHFLLYLCNIGKQKKINYLV